MAEVVQCDVCKGNVDPGDHVARLVLSVRDARIGGALVGEAAYDVCVGCLENIQLHMTDLGWPEVVGVV